MLRRRALHGWRPPQWRPRACACYPPLGALHLRCMRSLLPLLAPHDQQIVLPTCYVARVHATIILGLEPKEILRLAILKDDMAAARSRFCTSATERGARPAIETGSVRQRGAGSARILLLGYQYRSLLCRHAESLLALFAKQAELRRPGGQVAGSTRGRGAAAHCLDQLPWQKVIRLHKAP